jgi:IS5 family transposase
VTPRESKAITANAPERNLNKAVQALKANVYKIRCPAKLKYRRAGETHQKWHIRKTVFTKIPPSDFQLTKLSSLYKSDPEKAWSSLSPRQLTAFRELSKKK